MFFEYPQFHIREHFSDTDIDFFAGINLRCHCPLAIHFESGWLSGFMRDEIAIPSHHFIEYC